MATYSPHMPQLFGALSDPTRLAVIERLLDGPASVTELSEPFAMARPSFLKHLKVLENAGVVSSKKTGRVRTVRLETSALGWVEDWVQAHRRRLESKLDRLGTFLEQEQRDDGCGTKA